MRGSAALLRRKTSWGCMPAIVFLLSDLLQRRVREQDAFLADLGEPDRGLSVLPIAGHLHDHALPPSLVHDGVAFFDRGGLALGDRRHRRCLPSPLDRDLAGPTRQPDDGVATARCPAALLSAVPRPGALLDARLGLLRVDEMLRDLTEETRGRVVTGLPEQGPTPRM